MFEFHFSIPVVMSIATFESLPTVVGQPDAIIDSQICRALITRDGRNLWHAVERTNQSGAAVYLAAPILILAYALEPD